MTDIVERLRFAASEPELSQAADEAADEIERLREHVNALLLVATSHEPEALRQQAEIERLRALILDACTVFEHYDLPEHALHYRRALENKP